MGQTTFTDTSLRLTYRVIDETNHYVEVEKQLNEFNNNQVKIVDIPATVNYNGQEYTVTKIANNGFQYSNSLQTVTIPNTVTQIGNNAFHGCGMLEEVDMPNTITEIGSAAFQECHKLHSISLPSSLTTISDDLFHSCHNLNEIILPAGIVSIGERAFQNTHDVEIIFLGCGDADTVTIHSSAFTNCYNDHIEILCLGDVLNFKDENGALINFGNNTVFHVPCGKVTDYDDVYPDNITINDANCVSVSRRSGPFCLPETWVGYDNWSDRGNYEAAGSTYEAKEAWLKNGDQPDRYPNFVPRKPDHPFYIKQGHRVELNHSRHIYPFNSINEGVLVVNVEKGGQLIERDSLFFDEHYTIQVEYQINKVGDNVFITRNHHESTDITALLSSNTTCGDYRYENGNIRDTETRYLISITASGDNYSVSVQDKDYYRTEGDQNNKILYYYGNYPTEISYNVNDLNGTPNANGFWKVTENSTTYIKHNKIYNGDTTTVTINMSGNVTLHGTDYDYVHVKMHENLGGEIEIVVPATQGKWNFVGAPFKDYDLYAVKVGPQNKDITIVQFDYETRLWSNNYSTVDSIIEPGEGFLAWPFYSGGIVFSTKRDLINPTPTVGTKILEEDFSLNNDDVVVTKSVSGDDNSGRWIALANPYPAKLCVNSFVLDNSGVIYNDNDESTQIQGQGVYVLDASNNSFIFKTQSDNYDLGVGEGFFVNVASKGENTIRFKKDQLHEYNESSCVHESHNHAKSLVKKEFIRLAMVDGNKETELLFTQNEKANQSYDIFDANKLFAMDQITEPYFVTDGMSLVKEEVKTLPYYAQMNVRCFEDKEVTFRLKDIPEDLVVFLIDNGNATRMNGGVEYRTKITAGENANRFQLLVKKASTIEDAKDNNIEISNSNRFVSISSTQTDLQIEVYNALGQKIMTTNNYNFNLNEASAGAYIVKAYNKAVSKTQKIVIK